MRTDTGVLVPCCCNLAESADSHTLSLFTPDEDLAPRNLSDLPKATKGASMDKRQEKYLGGT